MKNGQCQEKSREFFLGELHCHPRYYKCSKLYIVAMNIIRGTLKHGYAILLAYTYMVNTVNPGSINAIVVDEENMFK